MSDTTTRPTGATGEGTVESPWFPDVFVQLSGNDGNAFAIMGNVSRELRNFLRENNGLTPSEQSKVVDQYREESMSGDYDNLLQTAMRWVEVG